MRKSIFGATVLVALLARPAQADLKWQPEGRFYMRLQAPVQGTLSGEDPVFDLLDARLGTRLFLLPGLSLRAVAQVLHTQTSRFPPVLRWGYVAYRLPLVGGTIRAGQVPTPWGEKEEQVVGDPVLGQGVALTSGFIAPGGLGATLSRRFPLWGPLSDSTASAVIGGFYTDGLLGNGELTPQAVRPDIMGSGPAVSGRLSYALPDGLSAHLLGRWGTVQDQQIGLATAWDGSGWHLVAEAIASTSNPVYSLPGGQTLQDTLAADGAALVGARYDLGELSPALAGFKVLARLSTVFRNFTDTTRATDSVYPVGPPGEDYTGDLALEYAIDANTEVALDAQVLRSVLGSATQSVSLGIRVGVQF